MILSADPGVTGALCCFDEVAGRVLSLIDMPARMVRSRTTGKERLRIDEDGVKDWLIGHRALGARRMVIEKVSGLPGQSAPNAFTFGYGFGVLLSTARLLNYEVHQVRPQEWRTAHFRISTRGTGKQASLGKARRMFPEAAQDFKRVKDHGRAEAALIAAWAAQTIWRPDNGN